ncbi:MAG: transcriptional repressor LexA [Bacteroidetes bacterium]|nr:transcriptional repressor LexA [Bacteroidota bacterium]MBU1114103.1 transcriptional repressor LexA [Bacteroidota bacterium]MBU1800176.1 transcriptional repressor LexA [Bacteroidota bacterium]
MKNELTERQENIYQFIKDFIDFNSYPPTYREIGTHFNIVSTFGVKRHIDALIKKGFLNIGENSSRTISVIENNSIGSKTIVSDTIEIPIIGRVAAGQPILAEENIEGTINIQASLINSKANCFALKVKGDSMINAGIFEGDVVIINPQKDANNGEIVVAMIDNEATLKRFERKNGIISLIPENDNYSPIILNNLDNFSIIGKALGVFRWYN